jgi:hypothetical protein
MVIKNMPFYNTTDFVQLTVYQQHLDLYSQKKQQLDLDKPIKYTPVWLLPL